MIGSAPKCYQCKFRPETFIQNGKPVCQKHPQGGKDMKEIFFDNKTCPYFTQGKPVKSISRKKNTAK
jgi:hypothetical protein